MPCNCDLCIRTQHFQIALEKIPEQDQEYWSNLYSDLFNVEMDRDYYKAIVEGSWPDADQVISNHRQKEIKDCISEVTKVFQNELESYKEENKE